MLESVKKLLFKTLSQQSYQKLHHSYFLYRFKRALNQIQQHQPQSFLENELIFSANFIDEGDIFLDVGGYLGAWATFIGMRIGNEGAVHTFEPVNYPMLLNTLNNFKNLPLYPHPIALSDSRGRLTMRIPLHNGVPLFSTTHPEQSQSHHDKFIEKEVEKSTLDSFLSEHKIHQEKISLVKIDVEGSEQPLLKGAKQFLSDFSPLVICEIWFDNHKNEIHEIFTGLGFKAFKLGRENQLIDATDVQNFQKITLGHTYGNLIFCKPNYPKYSQLIKFLK